MNILGNAFSLSMVPDNCTLYVGIYSTPQEAAEVFEREGYTSAVGHEDTANIFQKQLGLEVPYNRVNISLKRGDTMFVGQYKGPRLPEGTTILPEGAEIVWKYVAVA